MLIRYVIGIVTFAALSLGVASAEPIDTWPITHGIDCLNDPYNPLDENGNRDPNGDPQPGTQAFTDRDSDNRDCAGQRNFDRGYHPLWLTAVPTYGQDHYRRPELWDGVRFRFDEPEVPGVPSVEIYRPCSNTPGECPNLPPEIERFDPPYPVVVVFHGVIASKQLHRMNGQVFAEAGYLAIVVNGTWPDPTGLGLVSLPNVQREANGTDVLTWLYARAHPIAQEADLDRVAFAGHSMGSAAALSYQGDPRVHAILAWDGGDAAAANNTSQPIMYQRTDGGFATPNTYTSIPDSNPRLVGYNALKSRNVDVFHFTGRATVHVDWNGAGGPGANRLLELTSNYYNLAWLDRHLKGKLVFDNADNVVTTEGRTEAQERAYRQAVAEDAYERLIAERFDDSADKHNISMGWWDPELAVANADPLFGGNVPYRIEGFWAKDRFSYYYRSVCSVSVPNYVAGGTGRPDDPVAPMRQADTTANGDMRFIGCPEISVAPVDSDGDGIPDDVDVCPTEPGPASNNGCPVEADTTPDPFGFTSVSGVSQGTVVSSNVGSISGIDAAAPVGINNGEYRINGGGWTSAPGQITNSQSVQVRHTSANAANTVTETVLTIGGVEGKFRSTTSAGGDTDPDAFSFQTQTGVAQSTVVVSNSITPVGYDTPTTVKAGAGTEYSLGCTQANWTSAQGVISPNTSICVRHTSAANANTLRKTSLQIGKTVGYFSTRTAP